jgi:hypothetical protein
MHRLIWLVMLVALLGAFAWAMAQTGEPSPTPAAVSPTPASGPPAAPGAGRQPIAEKIELTCPVCGAKTPGWKITAFVSSGVDTDFCQLGASDTYYQRMIATCPVCGYTGYNDDYPPALSALTPDVIAKIRKKIPRQFPLAQLEPWDRYSILAQIYLWRGKPVIEVANAYLRATYTMRGLQYGRFDRRQERELRSLAIKHLIKAQEAAQFPLAEASQVKYLIGELYRRNGEFGRAIRYFEDAQKIRTHPEWLDEMIIRQTARANAYDDS